MATSHVRRPRGPAALWSLDQVKSRLRELIEETAGIPAAKIRASSSIDGDLAMDSMSFVSLQVAVEETFGIRCDAEDLEELNRFDNIAQFVLEQTTSPKASTPPKSAHSRAKPPPPPAPTGRKAKSSPAARGAKKK